MAFIRNTDKFVEGSSNKFFSDGRAQLALQPTVTSLENEDSGMKLRLDVIEGGAGVEGSIAKAQADAQSYADQQIAALVNSAPEVLDTLKELSDAIGGDQNFAATVSGQIGAVDAKVDQEVLDRQAAISALQSSVSGDVSSLQSADSALSLRLDELELDPVTKSYVDSQDSSEASARQSADTALSGRLDTLEQDPTTKTYVDGEVSSLQGQITQEISDRQSGDSALSGRLDIIEGAGEGSVAKAEQDAKDYADGLDSAMDARMLVLEADPTTKSYVDSADSGLQSQITQEIADRQADVDAEEQRALAAEGLLSGRLDVLEADPVEKSYVDSQDSGLQSQIDTEKGRIDAILLSADADKDSFAEIVSLINSVDTTNDQAFAGYVASNDAALAQEVSDRQSGDNALSGRLDVLEADPTTKSYVDGEVDALEAEDLTMVKLDGSRAMTGALNIESSSSGARQIRLQANKNGGQLPANEYIGEYRFQVLQSDLSNYTSTIKLQGQAAEDHSESSLGSVLNIEVTPIGQTNREVVMSVFGDKIGVNKPMEVAPGFEMRTGSDEELPGKIEFVGNGNEQEIKIGLWKEGSNLKYPARFTSSKMQFERGLVYAGLRSYGSNRTISQHEPYIAVTAVNVTFTLPASPEHGQVHTFKDVTGSCDASNPITLSGTIDGGNSYQLTAPYESVMVMWNANQSTWMVM